MNMGQMLLVLLAVMLFSTILITTYSNLYTATDIVYKVMFQMQGLKIADKYIQKIDAELLGKVYGDSTFVDIYDSYHKDSPFNPGNPDTTMTINDADYNVWLTSNYCNSSGDISYPDSTYQKIDIIIFCTPMGPDTLWIGTRDKPISKIFIDMEG